MIINTSHAQPEPHRIGASTRRKTFSRTQKKAHAAKLFLQICGVCPMNFEGSLFFSGVGCGFFPGRCLALLHVTPLRRCECPVLGQGTLWHPWAVAQPPLQHSRPAGKPREGAAERAAGDRTARLNVCWNIDVEKSFFLEFTE